jgi:FeS assembly SUF system regulator
MKLGKLTDYATVIMTALAEAPETLRPVSELAQATRIAEPTVSKVMKALARAGLVQSERGAHGGYRLSRSPERISVADVVRALEGPIGLTACSVHGEQCSIDPHCRVRGNWRLISVAIEKALASVSLADMATPAASMPHQNYVFPLTRMQTARQRGAV